MRVGARAAHSWVAALGARVGARAAPSWGGPRGGEARRPGEGRLARGRARPPRPGALSVSSAVGAPGDGPACGRAVRAARAFRPGDGAVDGRPSGDGGVRRWGRSARRGARPAGKPVVRWPTGAWLPHPASRTRAPFPRPREGARRASAWAGRSSSTGGTCVREGTVTVGRNRGPGHTRRPAIWLCRARSGPPRCKRSCSRPGDRVPGHPRGHMGPTRARRADARRAADEGAERVGRARRRDRRGSTSRRRFSGVAAEIGPSLTQASRRPGLAATPQRHAGLSPLTPASRPRSRRK